MNHARQAAEQIDALQVSQDASIAMDQSEPIIAAAIDAAARERDAELSAFRAILTEHGSTPSTVGLTALACSYKIVEHENKKMRTALEKLRTKAVVASEEHNAECRYVTPDCIIDIADAALNQGNGK